MRNQSAVLQQKGIKAIYLKDVFDSNIEDGFENMTISDVKDSCANIICNSRIYTQPPKVILYWNFPSKTD